MAAEAANWDERYRAGAYVPGPEPAEFLVEVLPWLTGRPGVALDIAAGAGRNAIALAEQGWRVTAVDQSRVALEQTAAAAEKRGVAWVRGRERLRGPGIELVEADLASYAFVAKSFDAVLNFYYLDRKIFPAIVAALRPGGFLVFETFTSEQLRFAHGPRRREHLLEPGELRAAFPSLQTVFYREVAAGKGIASLLARKARLK